jgi:hypothetical protein
LIDCEGRRALQSEVVLKARCGIVEAARRREHAGGVGGVPARRVRHRRRTAVEQGIDAVRRDSVIPKECRRGSECERVRGLLVGDVDVSETELLE